MTEETFKSLSKKDQRKLAEDKKQKALYYVSRTSLLAYIRKWIDELELYPEGSIVEIERDNLLDFAKIMHDIVVSIQYRKENL